MRPRPSGRHAAEPRRGSRRAGARSRGGRHAGARSATRAGSERLASAGRLTGLAVLIASIVATVSGATAPWTPVSGRLASGSGSSSTADGGLAVSTAEATAGALVRELRASRTGQRLTLLAQQQARAEARREARQKAQREARQKAQREARQKAQREARQKAQRAARLAAERAARLEALREARSWSLPVAAGAYHLTARFGQCSALWSACHTGLDFAAPSGTPLRAVADGAVTEAGWAGAYGYRTILTLPDGTEIWYCHQSSMAVGVGASVVKGQLIGYVGATGNVTGSHLHLEVRPGGGDPVDPAGALLAHDVRP